MINAQQLNKLHLQSAQEFIQFLHGDSKALIQLVQLENKKMKRYRTYDVKKALNNVHDWIEKDCYISLNTFKKPSRTTENALRLNALYTDLDCYKIGIDVNTARSMIDELIAQEEIPIPNAIIYSGRGLQLIWLLKFMICSPAYLKLWNHMQNAIYDRLQCLNADAAAKSVSQIFRLVGSVHGKTNTVVKVEYLKKSRYSITDMKEFLLEELPSDWKDRTDKNHKKRLEKVIHNQDEQKEIKCRLTKNTLHNARLKDMETLLYIRNGNVNRRRFVFYYAITSARNKINEGIIRKNLERINAQFYKPLSDSVINGAITSSKHDYRFTNNFLITNLEITLDEQQALTTIISNQEKVRRKKLANEQIRRSKGIQTMQQYNDKRAIHKNELMIHIEKLHKQGMKQKDIAEYLSITKGRVSQLVKEIRGKKV